MRVDALTSLLIILVMALTTFVTRAVPFLIFPKGKEVPKIVYYLGRVLTPAVIGMLVIYCLKHINLVKMPFGIPEIMAAVSVIVLHLWKHNNLLSIGFGTVFYMVLVQVIFT